MCVEWRGKEYLKNVIPLPHHMRVYTSLFLCSEWSDWQESSDGSLIFCLFCSQSSVDFPSALGHMLAAHDFDYRAFCRHFHLDYYGQVKLVNYIRRQVRYYRQAIISGMMDCSRLCIRINLANLPFSCDMLLTSCQKYFFLHTFICYIEPWQPSKIEI